MKNFKTLDRILREQSADVSDRADHSIYDYGCAIAAIENVVAVVSDLSEGNSRIFCGRFGRILGLEDYSAEPSIWEKEILARMSVEEVEQKSLAELRFFHYLKRLSPRQRATRYLAMRLRMISAEGVLTDVLHRMYYIHAADGTTVRYAVCLYGPMTFDFNGKSIVVDSVSGHTEELTGDSDRRILGPRETQVLALIDRGLTSAEIARELSISKHTVSRHRQEILARLQVRNSPEACRIAKTMGII